MNAILASLGGPKTPFDWYAQFLLLSKYGEPHDVLTAVEKAKSMVRRDSFLARQAMVVLARAAGINFDKVYGSWQQEVSRGVADSASVAVNLMTFANEGFPSKGKRAYPYLFPKDAKGPYPLSKFLLLCAIAAGEVKAGKKVPRPEVEKFIVDPWMQGALHTINSAWFSKK